MKISGGGLGIQRKHLQRNKKISPTELSFRFLFLPSCYAIKSQYGQMQFQGEGNKIK
jgi:hypothetical protein